MLRSLTFSAPFFLLLAVLVDVSSAEDTRPNILYIMSDDHTTQGFGCYGSRLAALNPTPTLDRLAAEGMRFDRVFCNNSICTPSRASIITGQYPLRVGLSTVGLPGAPQGLSPEDPTLAEMLGR